VGFGGVDSTLGRARCGEDRGKAKAKVRTKGGGKGQNGQNGHVWERVCRGGSSGYDGSEGM
jgi:hypothetical protein